MGFNFIHTERIPGAANYQGSIVTSNSGADHYLPFWAKSGVALGIWNDITTKIAERPDKRHATQVYVTGTFGATRTEEARCGYIVCR
jgi:hypothetical protein